ncbi:MAG TPA: hypothetical protein VHE34_21295 [Puia sp.]|uniref:hypothetical protein n=1 Tax=Puia sp. TaxID=2045100 RepID=UPI002CF879D6|nr:hypothetical protein [Puia sp.]HVU97780.1 hypothetical protein [Puia sp.]
MALAVAATSPSIYSHQEASASRPIKTADFYAGYDASAAIYQIANYRHESFHELFQTYSASFRRGYNVRSLPFVVCLEGPAERTWLERYFGAQAKLDFYQGIRQHIRSDIAFIKNEYLIDSSAEIIRVQHKKLAAVENILGEIKSFVANPGNHDGILAASAEDLFPPLVSTQFLDLESAHAFANSLWDQCVVTPSSPVFPFLHVLLQRGRMKRYFAKRPIRDKRRYFRNLVRTLFKQMDDQSGHDEFLAFLPAVTAKMNHLPKIWSLYDEHRNHRRA